MAKDFWEDDLPAAPAAPPAPADADAFWNQDKPAAQRDLPADVTPSLAGAGRGSVNPPVVQESGVSTQPQTGPIDFNADSDPLARVTPSTPSGNTTFTATATPDAGGGRGFVNPPLATDDTRKDVGSLESLGRGYGKAGALSAKTFNLAVAAPVVLGEKLKNAITGSSDTSAQDAMFRNLVDPTNEAVNWYSLKPDEKQGFLAKVSESVGALVQDLPLMIASGGRGAQAKLAEAFPTTAQFMGNAIGQGFTAMRPLMIKAGVEKAQQVLDAGGTVPQALNSAATAAMITGFTGSQPMSATGPVFQRLLTGIPVGAVTSEAHRVVQNAADPAAIQQPFSLEDVASGAVTNAIMAGSMGHPAHVDPGITQERIERLRAAGEDGAADLLDKQLTQTKIAGELGSMGTVSQGPKFQTAYREQRLNGAKPAEAAARASMATGFDSLAGAAEIPDAAVAAAHDKAADLPLDKVPGFFERFIASITSKGLGKPLPPGTVDGAIGAARDQAVNAALDGVYNPAAMLEKIKRAADTKPDPDKAARAEPDGRIEPTFDPGNDVALTPEAEAVHQAATSPLNDLAEPSQAQKDAGNYKVGRLNIAGMDISVENPQGSVRRGVDAQGKPWETPLQDHYGYIRGTVGADKDHLDVFVKPGTPSDFKGPVFVVDQIDPATGHFDEHKAVLGAADKAEAEQVYQRNYGADWQGLGAITELPMPAFKAWAKSAHAKEPLGEIPTQAVAQGVPNGTRAAEGAPAGGASAEGGQQGADRVEPPAVSGAPDAALPVAGRDEGTAAQVSEPIESLGKTGGPGPAGGKNARSRAWDANPFTAFLGNHGISLAERSEFAPGAAEQRKAMVQGYGPIFRSSGSPIDLLAHKAMDEGFIRPDDPDAESKLRNMITAALAGERFIPQYAEGAVEREVEARMAEMRAHEEDAVAGLSELAENSLDVIDQALDDKNIPWDEPSNVSTEAAMRAMGFSDKEIEDEVARESGRAQENSQSGGEPGQTAGGQAPRAGGSREGQARSEVAAAEPAKTPADAGVSTSAFTWERRPSGTLAVTGDPEAVRTFLTDSGIGKMMISKTGVLVGRSEAEQAEKLLKKRFPVAAEPAQAKPLTVGIMPGNAEPVTVKDGVVHIGKAEAINFDTGEAVKVKAGASDADIKQALKDAGALSRRQKFFGGEAPESARPAAQAEKSGGAPTFSRGERQVATPEELATAQADLADLRAQRAAARGANRADLDARIARAEAAIADLDLTAPTREQVTATQERKANAPVLDEKAQIDREAEHQTLTKPTAPEQRKDTTGDLLGGPSAEEALAAKKKADEAKAKPAEDDGTAPMFHRAYHGSPHNFDKFSLDAIGTGEGAQAYGHGLYFAGNRAVAEYYKEKLAGAKVTAGSGWFSKGINLTPTGMVRESAIRKAFPHLDEKQIEAAHSAIRRVIKDKGVDEAIAGLKHDIDAVGHIADHGDYFKPQLAFLEQNRKALKAEGQAGKLYQVDIPEEGHYLLWDKKLSEQPPAVRAALEKLDVSKLDKDTQKVTAQYGDDRVAAAMYRLLAVDDKLGGQKGASKLLHSLGIAGIKYLDGSSRGKPYEVVLSTSKGEYARNEFSTKQAADAYATDKRAEGFKAEVQDNAKADYNYVVFDDSKVNIEAKFKRPEFPDLGKPALNPRQVRIVLAPALRRLAVPHELHSIEDARAATGAEIPPDAKGMYYKGTLHLFTDNLHSPLQAEAVFWHEVQHAGTDAVYGTGSKSYEQALRTIAGQNENIRQAAKAWMVKYGREDYHARIDAGATHEQALLRTKLQAVDEALAEMSSRNVKINGLPQFIAKVQEFMRSIGLERVANWLEGKTDAQALSMILNARSAVMNEPAGARAGQVAPAFSQGTSPELERLASANGEQRAATINLVDAQRELEQWQGFQRRSPGYKRAETRDNIAKAQRGVERAQAALERADARVTAAQAKVDALHPLDDPRNQQALFSRADAADDAPDDQPQRKPYTGPGAKLIESTRGWIGRLVNDTLMSAAPMSAGSDAARAVAKDYANAERVARTKWTMFDDVLKKQFTEEQRKKMWEAADEQNVLLQKGEDTAGKGLDRLDAKERAVMDSLHDYGEQLLQRAKDVGMFKGDGLPYWTPRMAVMIGGDGEFAKIPGEGKQATAGGVGRNVTTTAGSLKQRKYLTAEETEAAADALAKAKGGQGAQLVRDIRTMPMAMARLERAIAGRELIDQIKELGISTGIDTTTNQRGPNFFTLEHPAFQEYRYRPDVKFTEAMDKHLWQGLLDFAEKIGVNPERVATMRGRKWGYASTAGEVVTRFGGPETVLTHELGHQLDFKYGLADMLTKRGITAKELRALADLRYEGSDASATFKKYVRQGTEKIANMVHAYVHAKDRFAEVAPNTLKAFESFLDEHPELADLKKIRASLVLDTEQFTKRPPGEDFDVLPIYVSKDFEGPLKAILSETSGELYKAMMALKGKSMGLIMYSPLIHNAVEWGRALPMMPGKVATFQIYFSGNKLKNDPIRMMQAVRDGLVPIGHRGNIQDITGLAEEPSLAPGRSWTAKLLGGALSAPLRPLSKGAAQSVNTAVRKGVDAAGDFWHNTLLWDRVGDLQAGLYGAIKSDLTRKGMGEDTAGRLAAHFANRYAGALPNEAMSVNARKIANFVLFSRSFTLGNLGVMKDMLTGFPPDVAAQIKRDAGEDMLKTARSIGRRKAIAAFGLDIALMYAGNALLQSALDKMRRDKSLDEIEKGYLDRFDALVKRTKESPLDVLSHPLDAVSSLTPNSANEPGREDRIHYGTDDKGTNIYARMPTGKIGEEFKNWITSPLQTLLRKQGTVMRPITQTIENDKGFGQRVYNPDDPTWEGMAKNIGRVVWNFMSQQIPLDSMQSAVDLAKGKGDDTDKLKVLGPLAGVTFSKGAPGGPEVGEMYHENKVYQGKVADVMPDVRHALKVGDEGEAIKLMESVGMSDKQIDAIIRKNADPQSRLNSKALKDYYKHASQESQKRMENYGR